MNKKELILAGLATSNGKPFTPVQVQKLFFLIDRNIPDEIGGPVFNFQPYNYGPFDRTVYDTLRALQGEALVDIASDGNLARYKLTVLGQEQGDAILALLSERAQKYLSDVSVWVRKLSFTQLVSAIYKDYPEMKQNSVFQE